LDFAGSSAVIHDQSKERKQIMIIRCWGARGSIPVSGPEYLKYGGDTACLEIRTADDEIIIVDAGSGIRKLGNRLLAEGRSEYSLVFTHSHWDHILGFPFFKPIYRKETSLHLYGCSFGRESVKEVIARVMTSPNFPVDFNNVQARISYQEFCQTCFAIRSMTLTPIFTSHPNSGIGYKFSEMGRTFVFITDNELRYKHPGGLDYDEYVRFVSGADLLLHDSEFTEEEYQIKKTWGHSTYRDALQLALDARVKKFGLFHHNQERTDAALDEIVDRCRQIIKARRAPLECFASQGGMEIRLE
jgi:phosphoribosyl 1,2-cyclic phosphodiesterase